MESTDTTQGDQMPPPHPDHASAHIAWTAVVNGILTSFTFTVLTRVLGHLGL
jgi:hypothetical protein